MNPMDMDATGPTWLMIENTSGILQTVVNSFGEYWPEATLLSTSEGFKGIELTQT